MCGLSCAEEELERIRDVVERYPYIALVSFTSSRFIASCSSRVYLYFPAFLGMCENVYSRYCCILLHIPVYLLF